MVSSAQGKEQHGQPHAQSRVPDMISLLTNRLTGLGRPGERLDANNKDAGDDDNGVIIITLAGEDKGATMKGNMEECTATSGGLHDNENSMIVYNNGNYQGVNNSIVFEGNCEAEDPGILIEISDCLDDGDNHAHDRHEKKKKYNDKKKKRKDKENSEDEKVKESEQ